MQKRFSLKGLGFVVLVHGHVYEDSSASKLKVQFRNHTQHKPEVGRRGGGAKSWTRT